MNFTITLQAHLLTKHFVGASIHQLMVQKNLQIQKALKKQLNCSRVVGLIWQLIWLKNLKSLKVKLSQQ